MAREKIKFFRSLHQVSKHEKKTLSKGGFPGAIKKAVYAKAIRKADYDGTIKKADSAGAIIKTDYAGVCQYGLAR